MESSTNSGQVWVLPIKVLLVEDVPGDARLLRETLADGPTPNIELEWTDTLLSTLERLESGGIDLILLDLKMPGMGGQELYSLIKESDSRMAKKIIFITGDTLSGDTHDFLSATGNPSVSKPFQGEQLHRVIRDLEEAKDD